MSGERIKGIWIGVVLMIVIFVLFFNINNNRVQVYNYPETRQDCFVQGEQILRCYPQGETNVQ